MGMTVAAMSMITVPETTGVNMRRSSERRAAIMNWNADDTTTRLAIVAGPPSDRDATHTAMNAPDVPMINTCPEPMRPTRTACSTVVAAADYQRREYGPGHVAIGLVGNAGHDDHRQHHRRDDYHGGLQAGPDGYRDGRLVVRFVANVFVLSLRRHAAAICNTRHPMMANGALRPERARRV